jgi:hypothetical protein
METIDLFGHLRSINVFISALVVGYLYAFLKCTSQYDISSILSLTTIISLLSQLVRSKPSTYDIMMLILSISSIIFMLICHIYLSCRTEKHIETHIETHETDQKDD